MRRSLMLTVALLVLATVLAAAAPAQAAPSSMWRTTTSGPYVDAFFVGCPSGFPTGYYCEFRVATQQVYTVHANGEVVREPAKVCGFVFVYAEEGNYYYSAPCVSGVGELDVGPQLSGATLTVNLPMTGTFCSNQTPDCYSLDERTLSLTAQWWATSDPNAQRTQSTTDDGFCRIRNTTKGAERTAVARASDGVWTFESYYALIGDGRFTLRYDCA